MTELQTAMVKIGAVATNGNVRKYFDEKKMKELTESVKKHGILLPLLVRVAPIPLEDQSKRKSVAAVGVVLDEYILIAGERRLRAAKEAGLKDVPVRILDVDEAGAAEIQALENLHRADLTPIEEAQAFKQLMDKSGYAVKDLAHKVDKSEAYVYRAVKLLDLPEKLVQAIEEGKVAPSIGHLVAAVGEKYRESLTKFVTTPLDWHKRLPTIDEVKREIEKSVERKLSKAIFPTKKPYADAVACTECPFNSGNQDLLIPGVEDGLCSNPGCYSKKTNAFEKEFAEKSASRFPGLKFVGTEKDNGYMSQNTGPGKIKGHFVIGAQHQKLPGVKKLLKEKPEIFGYGITVPSKYSTSKVLNAWLVCVDPDELNKVLPKATPTEDRAYQQPKPRTEREIFIEQKVTDGMNKIAHETLLNAKEKDLLGCIRDAYEQNSWRGNVAVGLKINLRKMSLLDCARLFVASEMEGLHPISIIKLMGGDPKKFETTLLKAVEAELEKDKPVPATATKKVTA